MSSATESIEIKRQLISNVRLTADALRCSIGFARGGPEEVVVDDEVILEKINECLSQVGFLAIRKPGSKASSGTDPWDR